MNAPHSPKRPESGELVRILAVPLRDPYAKPQNGAVSDLLDPHFGPSGEAEDSENKVHNRFLPNLHCFFMSLLINFR